MTLLTVSSWSVWELTRVWRRLMFLRWSMKRTCSSDTLLHKISRLVSWLLYFYRSFLIVGPFRSPPQPEPLILSNFMKFSTPGTICFNLLMVWFTGPKSPVWSPGGGGQKCHDWNAHLIFFHHDWWKFDGIKLFQSSRWSLRKKKDG